ncbi:MAG: Asp-tRNA(Asn)/Glu-tRNA(Gln) amidotransferase subunit GatB [Candidatus Margulisbacteria bacterium]|nr:Asp-tRNA(Asn)/Glu-tRNA(Gln) amidotransferase subunit GatB [Candidatus Margulisiibacteriota bacterium]
MNWEVVIGLEIHAQMATKSKLMCNCDASFSSEPNTHVCPGCTGQPGMLPVVNKQVVDNAIMLGLATKCDIRKLNEFARKSYFYPDLPGGYQISQYDKPICENGKLEIEVNGNKRTIGITRIHMEEDAGKLVHAGSDNIKDASYSLVDLNRASVPLCEIVSEPDLRSAEEAIAYAQKIRQIVRYLGVCDGNMEEGSMRCDANVSVRPKGQIKLGTKAEVKNLNSFKAIEKAINIEVERQIDILEDGGEIIQETRHYNEATNSTKSMRSKEDAHDYRYFPDPDLVPLLIDDDWILKVRNLLPELPEEKKERYINSLSLSEYDASIITTEKETADFFEETISYGSKPKETVNWIMSEVLGTLNQNNLKLSETKLTPKLLAELLILIDKNTISGKIAKTILPEIIKTGKNAEEIIKEKGLAQVSDQGELKKIVETVIKENAKVVEDIKNGNPKARGFLIGQIMKKSNGKANPGITNELLNSLLN